MLPRSSRALARVDLMEQRLECFGGPYDGEWVAWPTDFPILAVPLTERMYTHGEATQGQVRPGAVRYGVYALVDSRGIPIWCWEGELAV